MLAALKTLPAIRPWAAELSSDAARLLDDVGFTEDPVAYARAATATVAHMALLVNTAYSAREVATALNVNESRVRQRRLARTLWTINDNGACVFPALQFETDPQTGQPCKQIRGLDRVFAALAPNLHPLAVAGFLRMPHPDLALQGRSGHPLEWLQSGGDVDPVLRPILRQPTGPAGDTWPHVA